MEPVHALYVHAPTVTAQQHVNPPVAVPHARLRDLFDPRPQVGLIASAAFVMVA